MNYYEIRDRVPCSEIDALTVEAARVWLERNGWETRERWTHRDGSTMQAYANGASVVPLPAHDRFTDRGLRMAQLVELASVVAGIRVAQCIGEIRDIAEWQKRCAEWVPPADKCDACWACIPSDLLREVPRFIVCPTCGNKRCPRATDHRNECSGSNEAGQEGSRYA